MKATLKSRIFSRAGFLCLVAALFCAAPLGARAAGGELKLEAQLVVGTNQGKPQDSGLKPVSHDIEKKLKHLPLKWDHYYVAGEKKFKVAEGKSHTISLSQDCQVSVKNLGDCKVEVTLMNRSLTIGRVTQTLRKGQTLVTGGSAENSIVVLWQ